MELTAYLTSLSVFQLFSRMPAAAAQGLLWGLMALGVFLTFRVLDIADLTVDGSFPLGGAISTVLVVNGMHPLLALLLVTGLLGLTACGGQTGDRRRVFIHAATAIRIDAATAA